MRLKVKSLFMIVAGLLFFAGPMAGSAFAQTANVGVSGGPEGNVGTCSPLNGGSAAYVSDGNNKYEIVYKFADPAGKTSCQATIPIQFNLYNTSGQYNFSTTNAPQATWTYSSFSIDNTATPNPTHSYTDVINLNATNLTSGKEYTYTPTYSFSGCTGSCSTSTVTFENPEYGTLDGKVVIEVYVDGRDQLGITGLESVGLSGPLSCTDNGTSIIGGSVKPTRAADSSTYQWVYTYHINAGQTVCDAVPINLNVLNRDSGGDATRPAYEINIACDPTKSSKDFCNSAHAEIPLSQPQSLPDGSDGSEYVWFNSGQLNTPDTYDFFFKVSDKNFGSDDLVEPFLDCATTNCSSTEPSDGYVHIQIVVSAPTPNTQAFFTDGNFAGLLNCAGVATKSKDGVTFDIVPGGKGKDTIESTNPGDFFYNMIWTNDTTSEQTITFSVPTAYNVASKGDEPVHVYAFNSQGFDPSVTNFDTVLGYGTPCADPTSNSNTCTIQEVPKGDVVWIVWHVSYSQIGNSTSGLPKYSGVCPNPTGTVGAKNNIYADGQITYTGLGTPISASASAWGYLKH